MYDSVVGIFFFLVYDPCVSSVGRRFVKRACLVAPGIVCVGSTVNCSSILAFGLCYPALVVVGKDVEFSSDQRPPLYVKNCSSVGLYIFADTSFAER